jgi:uncharacterized protein (TIGR03083 family)
MLEDAINRLRSSVDAFTACVLAVPDERFLRTFSDWSPRDVLAHLIGWNEYTVTGCQQIRQGEAPFYLSDEPNDFSHVNAASVQRYAAQDKQDLLGELRRSADALLDALRALDPADWERDFGARDERGRPEIIRNHVEALIADYSGHQREIERWAQL